MELQKAKAIAEELLELLKLACERVTIAGSIRRRRPDVGDIEILAIPKFVGGVDQLDREIGALVKLDGVDQLDREIGALVVQRILGLRRNKRGSITYGPQNKLLLHRPSGIGVDVFSVTESNWGMALFVRTGPKEWNIKAMSRFRELGRRGHAYGGITDSDGSEITCPDEKTVFKYLQWAYIPPERR